MNCRMGMYANKTIYIDIEEQTTEVVDYKIKELKLKKMDVIQLLKNSKKIITMKLK